MKHFTRMGLASLCWFVGTTGCTHADYGGLEVSQLSEPPQTGSSSGFEVTDTGISIQLGLAVLVKVLPRSRNDQPYTANDDLLLSSSDPSVFGAFEADRPTRIVLTGSHLGEACLRVQVNQEEIDCFPVHVTPQPSSGE